jgi:hypothetical protein
MKVVLVGLFIFLSQVSIAKAGDDFLDDLAVLVTSCDKYEEAWHPFFTLLNKYWPELTNKKYLISNKKTYNHSNIIPVQIPDEKSWADNMHEALDRIEENYIMIFIEDYMITEKANHQKVKEYYDLMRKESAAYLKLQPNDYEKAHPDNKGVAYMGQTQEHRTALQLAIWRKDILRELLKKGENPWQFELDGNERSFNIKDPFMVVTHSIVPYSGAIEKGHWWQWALDFLKKEGIHIKPKLPILEKSSRIYFRRFRFWVHEHITGPIKKLFGIEKFKILPTTW